MAKPRSLRRSRQYGRRSRLDPVALAVPALAAAAAILALAWINSGPGPSAAISSPLSVFALQISVIDGDTVRVSGAGQSVRLVGYNAPESHEPRCAREAQLGEQAKRRLRELVAAGNLDLTYVRCACPPGTEGTRQCNHGRACGTLRADGRDVADILIGEGLAVRFVCGGTRCPPTPRPWC